MNYLELDKEYVANTYKRLQIVLTEGKGASVSDIDGKEYIDFTSGIGVNSLGFCHKEWAEAISKQANTLQHTSNLYHTTPCIEVAETICKRTNYKKMFFANSGAEANEGAIKVARKYSYEKYGEGRYKILTLINSFHGRTITTLKATGQDFYHQYFFPFTDGFSYGEANNTDSTIAELKKGGYCAVMMELVQGEGGVIALDSEYVKAVHEYCVANDILFIVDEVQTGIGRTGTLLASEQFSIQPDITTIAKGIGGGLPIGGFLLSEKTEFVLKPSDHGTTFGGNPVVCAGAKVVLKTIDDMFLKEVQAKGDYIRKELEAISEVASVTGLGMMIGIELKTKQAPDIIKSCLQTGLILLTAKSKLRLLPPLNISYEEIDKGLSILKDALSK